jgi:hypothetical protein
MPGALEKTPTSARTTRLHVVGCHRSGTTLMAELLGNCFHVDGRVEHEQSLWDPIPATPGGVFLTKKPPDTVRINRVFRLDPGLYVVAMIRDPRGVITSRHKSKPTVYFASFWRWERYIEAITELQDHPRYLAVRYEDLVTSPDAVQQRIAAAFPFLRPTGLFSRFPEDAQIHERARVSLNGVRSVDRGSLTRWRNDLPRVKGELERHPRMNEWLVRLGYEPDDTWQRCLDDVEPYFGSYKNERPHLFRRTETSLRFAVKSVRYLWQRRFRWSP